MSDDPGVSTSAGGGAWRAVFAQAQRARRWPSAVLLVVVADLLFWQQEVGLSLALFAVAVFAVATADVRPMRALVGPASLLACGALPVVEFAQPLSVAFLIAGRIGALA